MGYLLHIVLALVAQGSAEAGWTTGERVPLAVLLVAFAPYLLTALARQRFVSGHFRSGDWIVRLQGILAPFSYWAALALFGWQAQVEAWFGHDVSFLAWPEPALFLVLLPFVVYELVAIDARSRLAGASKRDVRAWRGFQSRMFLSGILPIVVYLLISSLVGWNDDLRIQVEEVALFNAIFATVLLIVLALFLPSLLRTTWETEPIADGPQRNVLLAVAERARFRSRALLVWKTGNTMANAAIVGLGPKSRVVLFSDSLLTQLPPHELAAVFAHEIGHALRHHVPIFALWVLAFFLGADLVATWLFPDDIWFAGGLVLGVMGLWSFAFGFLSRRFELDADLYSLDLLDDPKALIGALERVGGRLRDVASWRHFSTADRVRFLERAATDPAVGKRLRRGLRRWTIAGIVLFTTLLAIQGRELAAAYPENRVRADLRLGHYARASERGERIDELDPHLSRLLERARSVSAAHARSGERIDADTLEVAAGLALAQGDARAALDLLELGALRGRDDLREVGVELLRRIDPEAEGHSRLPPDLEERWAGLLERALPSAAQ